MVFTLKAAFYHFIPPLMLSSRLRKVFAARKRYKRVFEKRGRALWYKCFIICGENGYRAAHSKIENALEQSKIKYYFSIFKSTCCIEAAADDLAKEIKNGGYDLVIGVGGGVFMDQAKLTAARAGTRLIQIPTSFLPVRR